MRLVIFYATLFLLLCFACEQEALPILEEENKGCNYNYTVPENIEKDSQYLASCPIWPGEQILDRYQYYYPTFNPNNNDEIAYRRWDIETGITELWKFNFCTGEASFVAPDAYESDWSVKDWIIYTGTDLNIWKVKSNGDSLTQLTFSGNFNVQPHWDTNGERFIYRAGGGNIIMANEYGEHLDTLETISPCRRFKWVNDSVILVTQNAAYMEKGIGYYNLNTEVYQHLDHFDYLIDTYNYVEGLAWSKAEQSVIWQGLINVSKTNFHSGERTLLNETNPIWHYYFDMDVSADGKTIALYCIDVENIDICKVRWYERIYLMDGDGSNERLVQFPE